MQLHSDGYISHTDHAPAAQHNKHGHRSSSRSTHKSCNAMGKGKQKIEQSNDMCFFHSESNHFGSLLKAAINTGLAKYTIIPTISAIEILQRIPIRAPFFCPVIFLCAQILTDKCGQSHRKTGNRQKTKSLNLGICPASSNSQLAEAVDIRLHYHVCNGDHGILDASRKTVGYDLFQHIGVQANIPKGNRILLRASSDGTDTKMRS